MPENGDSLFKIRACAKQLEIPKVLMLGHFKIPNQYYRFAPGELETSIHNIKVSWQGKKSTRSWRYLKNDCAGTTINHWEQTENKGSILTKTITKNIGKLVEQSNPTSSGQIFDIEHWYVHSQYAVVEFFIVFNSRFSFCSCFIEKVIPIATELVDEGIEIEEVDLPTNYKASRRRQRDRQRP